MKNSASNSGSFVNQNGKRVIRGPQLPSLVGNRGYDGAWEQLRSAIEEILQKNAAKLSFVDIYQNAYNLVLRKHGERLYQDVKSVIQTHLEQRVVQGVLASAFDPMDFLAVIREQWTDFKICMMMNRDVLMYLDRVYTSNAGVPQIYESGLNIWRDTVLRSTTVPVARQLQNVILNLIESDRNGNIVKRDDIRDVTDMLVALGADPSAVPETKVADGKQSSVYETHLETLLLQDTEKYYRRESREKLSEGDASAYLKHVELRLQQEKERAKICFHSTSVPKIMTTVDQEFLNYSHCEEVMKMDGTGLYIMLDAGRIDDLSRMYQLFGRVPEGQRHLRLAIGQYVLDQGKKINDSTGPSSVGDKENKEDENETENSKAVSAKSIPTKWVDEVLQLKQLMDDYLKRAWNSDNSFEIGLEESFQSFMNESKRPSEYLCIYLNEIISGKSKISEDELNANVDRAIKIFRFLREKDVFEEYYKRYLARRLLFSRSVSEDLERAVISKLRIECGYQFTTKMEGMFTDISVSKETMGSFREYLSTNEIKLGLDLNVSVLTSTFWPVSTSVSSCILPTEMQKAAESFAKFYTHRHTGRKITWQTTLGSVDMRASLKDRYDLNVSIFQATVLLHFNSKLTFTFSELLQLTDIPRDDLARHVLSLSIGKIRLLSKEPKTRAVQDTDQFTLNVNFTSKMRSIKIPLIPVKSMSGGGGKSTESLDQDANSVDAQVQEWRKLNLDACIVRIMKSRKTLDHTALIVETTQHVKNRFLPDPKAIKQRIELLLDKEFLRRDEKDPRIYHYVA